MSDVDGPWTQDADIRDYTDTDIEQRRTKYTKVSDTSGELRALAVAVGERDGLDVSEVLDRALRVAVARVIDDHEVPFRRDDYDVALLVPPRGWLARQSFETISEDEVVVEDVDDRGVGFSTPPAVYQMASEIVAEDVFESVTALVGHGVGVLAGRE